MMFLLCYLPLKICTHIHLDYVLKRGFDVRVYFAPNLTRARAPANTKTEKETDWYYSVLMLSNNTQETQRT